MTKAAYKIRKVFLCLKNSCYAKLRTLNMKSHASRLMTYVVNRPFFVLLGGAGFAHLINFLSAPLLTRLYEPEAFGLLSLFATSLAVAGAVAGGRYEQAIVGETSDKFADELVFLVGMLALSLVSALPLILPLIAPLISSRVHISQAVEYLAPAVFAYSLGQAFTSWLVRKGRFSTTSAVKVLQALIVLTVSLFLAGSDKGLIIASMAGYLVACTTLGLGARRNGWPNAPVKFFDIWLVFRRHIKFPIMGMLPALFDSLCMLLPVYWIAIYFSATDTGQFGLTRQVLAAPLGMISLVVTQLLMKRLTDAKASRSSMAQILKRVLFIVAAPVLALGVLVSIAGPELFAFVFGEIWRDAGSMARWMVWAYIAPMLVSPLSIVLIVLRKIGSNGIWQTVHCLGMLLLVSFGTFEGIAQFIQMLVVFELVSYLSYAALIAHATYAYEKTRHAK